jgi:hypothetical protein
MRVKTRGLHPKVYGHLVNLPKKLLTQAGLVAILRMKKCTYHRLRSLARIAQNALS